MHENDFHSISCEIMDSFKSNFESLLLLRLSIHQQFTVGVCERKSYTFWSIILKLLQFLHNSFETSQNIKLSSEMCQYFVKEVMKKNSINIWLKYTPSITLAFRD